MVVVSTCPCCSGLSYDNCCRPLLEGVTAAPTAQRLMRSRYSAFTVGLSQYLLATWHPDHRPRSVHLDPAVRWTALEILGSTGGSLLQNHGTVEFRAHYRAGRLDGEQHENSEFVRLDGQWVYVGPVG